MKESAKSSAVSAEVGGGEGGHRRVFKVLNYSHESVVLLTLAV